MKNCFELFGAIFTCIGAFISFICWEQDARLLFIGICIALIGAVCLLIGLFTGDDPRKFLIGLVIFAIVMIPIANKFKSTLSKMNREYKASQQAENSSIE